MLTGRKYRLALTPEQEAMCEEFGHVCRAVWNTALEQRREYARRGAWISYAQQSAQLTEAKQDFEWLRTPPAVILQQTLRDLDRTCRTHGTFRARWRAKNQASSAFRFPNPERIQVERLNRRWGRVRLAKLGWVKFRWTRHPGGEVRSATVSRKGTHWSVSFLVEDGILTPEDHLGSPAGIDRGVATAVATSTGAMHHREFSTQAEVGRYRRLRQRLSRQKRGGTNRLKTLAAMRTTMGRITSRRADFCAQTASVLVAQHDVIVLEALKIRNMTSSAKGSKEVPGRQVRQKSGLNRAILDAGWGKLELALRSAARYTGTQVVLVNPAYTSQTCFRCKEVDPKSRESQAVFVCTACGHRDHADVNAAKNILCAAGYAVPACGDLGGTRSVKQEPAGSREAVPIQPGIPVVGIPSASCGRIPIPHDAAFTSR